MNVASVVISPRRLFAMLFFKRIVIIFFGTFPLASGALAQDQSVYSERSQSVEEQPLYRLPFTVPVDIIDEKANSEARDREEIEARQREKDDLLAQQGMNLATQAMNDATQRMANYALWSTILVGIGTVLLFVTLYLTRQANLAAQAAVSVTREIGQLQTRAWVGFNSWEVYAWGDVGISVNYVFKITWKNFGPTPAFDTSIIAERSTSTRFDMPNPFEGIDHRIDIPPNSNPISSNQYIVFSPDELLKMVQNPVVVKSLVRYRVVGEAKTFRTSSVELAVSFIGMQPIQDLMQGKFSAGNFQVAAITDAGSMT